MVSSVTVTHAELDEFIAIYRAACEEALSEAPRLERGAWCRFCAAKPICPAHTGPLLDLAQFVVPTPPAALADEAAYLQALAVGLDLVDAIKDIRTALHDQAKRALENGDQVPGYALSAGRAERHWHDENAAIDALIRLGLARDDVIAETMRSPKQVELRAKARGLKVPTELIVSHRSGVSLVRSENVRVPVPGRGEIARSFSAALEAFQEGGNHDDHDTRSRPRPRSRPRCQRQRQRQRAGSRPGADGRSARLPGGARDGAQQRRHVFRRRPVLACRCCSSSATATAPGCTARSAPSSRTAAAGPSTRRRSKRGYICFGDGNKVLGERLVPVSQPNARRHGASRQGLPWAEQWAVNLKCLDGADAGIEVIFKPTTVGGIQAVAGLIEAVRDRLNGGQHDGKVSPIVQLEKDSYQHSQYGRVWMPVLTIVDWMPLNGPAPAPAPRQRRRRPPSNRVAGASPNADVRLKGEADCSGLA